MHCYNNTTSRWRYNVAELLIYGKSYENYCTCVCVENLQTII